MRSITSASPRPPGATRQYDQRGTTEAASVSLPRLYLLRLAIWWSPSDSP